MNWVQIRHRLPEENKNVLIYYDDEIWLAKLESKTFYLAYRPAGNEVSISAKDATHWCHLPDTPIQVEEYDCKDDSLCGRMMQYPFCKKHRHANDVPK